MKRKEAMEKLATMAQKYGLELYPDGHNLYDADGNRSYLNYSVLHVADADYIERKADVNIELAITVRRMGDSLTPAELARLENRIRSARMLLVDLHGHPIEYTEKW